MIDVRRSRYIGKKMRARSSVASLDPLGTTPLAAQDASDLAPIALEHRNWAVSIIHAQLGVDTLPVDAPLQRARRREPEQPGAARRRAAAGLVGLVFCRAAAILR
jgi:hypothetical protein